MAEVINERNTGVENEARTESCDSTRQRRLRVEDRDRRGFNQRSCALTVQVRDVDNGDLSTLEARCQVLGTVVDAYTPQLALRFL